MNTAKFDVKGMSCSSCAAHVEKNVSKAEGVISVQVNLLTNSMIVHYDEDKITPEKIEEIVKEAGYEAFYQKTEEKKFSEETSPKINIGETEALELKRRFWISFVFLLPLLYLSMGEMLGLSLPFFFQGIDNLMPLALTQFLLLIPIVVVNKRYFTAGLRALLKKAPTMDTLIALGSSAALIYGIIILYKIGFIQGKGEFSILHDYAHKLFFESAATILTLITLGKYIEAKAKMKTSDAISKLMDLAPKKATLLREGKEIEIPVDKIVVGDVIILKPGQIIPVDGIVLTGESSIDESALTGESIPVFKQSGDSLLSAGINQNGSLTFRATKVGDDTTLAQIIKLVEEASSSKAPISRLADKISYFFVPTVISIAIVTVIIWLIAGYPLDFALSTGISVLVISCPCALGLATPVAIMTGTGKGARLGLLFKSAETLETAHKVNVALLDKTGTITSGKPILSDVIAANGYSEDEILTLSATLESKSEHPLAHAIVNAAAEKQLSVAEISQFNSITGLGLEGNISGKFYFLGNQKLMEQKQIDRGYFDNRVTALESEGKTTLYLSDNSKVIGVIGVKDKVKEDSFRAISELKKMGIKLFLLTGDNEKVAKAIGKEVGIDNIIWKVLPGDKDKIVDQLKKEGNIVAMVGDGINDAPALTRADVGIALGNGSDIALETADIILINNRLIDVVKAVKLSRAVIRNIKQNLFWAFFYNILGIPLAAGVFYIIFGWSLTPMFAAAAMGLSSVTVVLNALRLRRFSPEI